MQANYFIYPLIGDQSNQTNSSGQSPYPDQLYHPNQSTNQTDIETNQTNFTNRQNNTRLFFLFSNPHKGHGSQVSHHQPQHQYKPQRPCRGFLLNLNFGYGGCKNSGFNPGGQGHPTGPSRPIYLYPAPGVATTASTTTTATTTTTTATTTTASTTSPLAAYVIGPIISPTQAGFRIRTYL